MNQPKKFVSGLRVFKPGSKTPDFIKANLVINKSELSEWLKTQGNEIRIDLKESKGKGSWYFEVNDYVPKEKTTDSQWDRGTVNIEEDPLPF
jgi:hypothetical protein